METTTQELELADYDVIILSTSAGKDSSVMVHKLARMAARQGEARGLDLLGRITAVHADLGDVEWDGVPELAGRQVARYGIPIIYVSRSQGLLEQVAQRGMWPSSSARFCTSDHKRDQVAKVITKLVAEHQARTGAAHTKVLMVMGLRAEESAARARKVELAVDRRASNGRRTVTNWLPILDWSEERVWAAIKVNGIEVHPAYGDRPEGGTNGMPRLSCTFCVLAGKESLVMAAQLEPAKAARYLAVEQATGHSFQAKLSMAQIIAEAEARTAAGQVAQVPAEPGCGLEEEHLGAAA